RDFEARVDQDDVSRSDSRVIRSGHGLVPVIAIANRAGGEIHRTSLIAADRTEAVSIAHVRARRQSLSSASPMPSSTDRWRAAKLPQPSRSTMRKWETIEMDDSRWKVGSVLSAPL